MKEKIKSNSDGQPWCWNCGNTASDDCCPKVRAYKRDAKRKAKQENVTINVKKGDVEMKEKIKSNGKKFINYCIDKFVWVMCAIAGYFFVVWFIGWVGS